MPSCSGKVSTPRSPLGRPSLRSSSAALLSVPACFSPTPYCFAVAFDAGKWNPRTWEFLHLNTTRRLFAREGAGRCIRRSAKNVYRRGSQALLPCAGKQEDGYLLIDRAIGSGGRQQNSCRLTPQKSKSNKSAPLVKRLSLDRTVLWLLLTFYLFTR